MRTLSSIDISVIISTYNSPEKLELVLYGYQAQTFSNFEILIADDGSGEETAKCIQRFRSQGLPIKHIWHEDQGFRKNKIVNRALEASEGKYCIFTDGDCIPRADFIASHRRLRRPKQFLAAGSHISIPETLHPEIRKSDITSGDIFLPNWIVQRGYRSRYHLRLTAEPWVQPVLNFVTHRPRVFTGNGSSVWKEDAFAVNGFDETIAYGGGDREFGLRLANHGIRALMCKYSLISLHLDHPRPYVDGAAVKATRRLRKQVSNKRITWTPHGLCSFS